MTGLEAFIIPALTSFGVAAETAATVGTVANVAGTVASAAGTYAGYRGQQAAGEAAAADSRRRAGDEIIAAQQRAKLERQKKERLISEQRARIGNSGGGTGGSAATLVAEAEEQGEYNAELELWKGHERAAGQLDEANMTLFENKQRSRALPFQLGSQIVSGLSSAAKSHRSYGGGAVISDDYDEASGWRTTTRKTSPYRYG